MEKIDKYFSELNNFIEAKGFKFHKDWFDEMFALHENDLDLHILYLDVLYSLNQDQKHEKEEMKFFIKASEILKDIRKADLLQKAKAYAYMGYLKYYATDRISYCDKSLDILNRMGGDTSEIKDLRNLCEEIKNSGSRRIMFYLNINGSLRTEL